MTSDGSTGGVLLLSCVVFDEEPVLGLEPDLDLPSCKSPPAEEAVAPTDLGAKIGDNIMFGCCFERRLLCCDEDLRIPVEVIGAVVFA